MQVKISGKEVKLPDFLIVGAAKSGTTSLYNYLKQHPQIFLPENKEPWFFFFPELIKKDGEIFSRDLNIVTDFKDYLDLFKDASNLQVLGEASTCYLYFCKETIENIKKYHPSWEELKIIVILRNPIERAFSHYLNDVSSNLFDMTFEKVIEKYKLKQLSKFYNYIDYGFYYNQIKSYKESFGQIKILLFDDLREKVTVIIQDLFNFLDVDTSFIPDTSLEYNVSMGSKNKLLGYLIYKPNILKSTAKTIMKEESRTKIKNKIFKKFTNRPQLENSSREFLREIYKEDILKLQDLINKDLTLWLK